MDPKFNILPEKPSNEPIKKFLSGLREEQEPSLTILKPDWAPAVLCVKAITQ